MRVKEVMVLGYAKEGCLEQGWREKTSGHCYWCGKCEDDSVGDKKVVLFPFRMMWEKFERINLACRKCYREFSGSAKAVKKNKSSTKKGRTK